MGENVHRKMNKSLPGEHIAVIEEAEPQGDYYVDGKGVIRAAKVATVIFDIDKRVVSLDGVALRSKPPEKGDMIVGVIEDSLPEDMQRMRVYKINGRESSARFTAIILSDKRRTGRGPSSKIGDIVRAKVMTRIDGMILASIADKDLGVLWTRCSRCGGSVVRQRDNTVKCTKCGHVDRRKLAPDFMSIDAII